MREDWAKLRKDMTGFIQEKLMTVMDGDIIVTECPQCHMRYSHPVGKPMAVMELADLYVEQMQKYQRKIAREILGGIGSYVPSMQEWAYEALESLEDDACPAELK